MASSPTIKDVAASAGVSIGTVSNVVHGKAGMFSAKTAARVSKAIRSTGYRPNHVARSLVRRRSHTFGVVVRRDRGIFTAHPYYAGVIEGVLERAAIAGYHMKIILASPDDATSTIARLEDGSVDGVAIIAPRKDSPLIAWANGTRLATVIASGGPDQLSISRVDVDDSTAVYEAVSWLIAQGHRRVGLIAGPPNSWSAPRREQGYRRALRDGGIAAVEEWRYAGDYTPAAGQAGALALLRVRPALTAIVCGNDRSALGALASLQQSGVRVPEDISVLGFDDIADAAHSHPPLTTIHHPIYEIGVKAAEVLLDQLEGREDKPTTHLLPLTLVERNSVASAPSRRRPGNGHNGGRLRRT